jgi:hypothetical protein
MLTLKAWSVCTVSNARRCPCRSDLIVSSRVDNCFCKSVNLVSACFFSCSAIEYQQREPGTWARDTHLLRFHPNGLDFTLIPPELLHRLFLAFLDFLLLPLHLHRA